LYASLDNQSHSQGPKHSQACKTEKKRGKKNFLCILTYNPQTGEAAATNEENGSKDLLEHSHLNP